MITLQFGAALEVARLRSLTTAQLRVKYAELFAKTPVTNNRSFLFKRLALKVQEPGGKALETRGKAEPAPTEPQPLRDPRLPGVGSILLKVYKGRHIKVVVGERDFTFEGERFRSLSAIARKLTGTPWNGFLFFGLTATVSA